MIKNFHILVFQNLKVIIQDLNLRALSYMILNFLARFFGALVQLYAISIFTKIHDPSTTSAIILIFGYVTWFQLFEGGLTQTIQNKFNSKEFNNLNISIIIIFHFCFTIIIGLIIFRFNLFSFLLLNSDGFLFSQENKKIFDVGCFILIITSNNLLIHRFLILYKKSSLSNFLLFFQSILTFSFLYFYVNFLNVDQLVSVIIYFSPQLLIYIPILVILLKKISKRKNKKLLKVKFLTLIKYSGSFLLISFLSSFLLGLDYLILSYFSDSKELLSYHVTIRFFYFSFMLYFAYVTFLAKTISKLNKHSNFQQIKKIKHNAMLIGFTSVILVYILVLVLNMSGLIQIITNGIKIDQTILFGAFIYFLTRVFADIRIVVAQNLSMRLSLTKLYIYQILISLMSMPFLCSLYGGTGVLISLTLSYLIGFFVKLDKK